MRAVSWCYRDKIIGSIEPCNHIIGVTIPPLSLRINSLIMHGKWPYILQKKIGILVWLIRWLTAMVSTYFPTANMFMKQHGKLERRRYWTSDRSDFRQAWITRSESRHYIHLPHCYWGSHQICREVRPELWQSAISLQVMDHQRLFWYCWMSTGCSSGTRKTDICGIQQPFPLCDLPVCSCNIFSTVEFCSVAMQYLRKHKTIL